MIHRALFGSVERFMGVLTEHYAGAFPPWLAPVQVVGIPITERHVDYLHEVAATLRAAGVRVEVDGSDDRMQKKIRNAQKQKVPYMLIAGDEDVAAGAVSFRYRDGTQRNGVPIARGGRRGGRGHRGPPSGLVGGGRRGAERLGRRGHRTGSPTSGARVGRPTPRPVRSARSAARTTRGVADRRPRASTPTW